MDLPAWIAFSAALCVAGWYLAATLRVAQLGRTIVALLIPFLVAATGMWLTYLAGRHPSTEAGWDALFGLLAIGLGATTLLVSLPLLFVLESRVGWRYR